MNLPNKRFLVFFLSVVMCFAFKMNVGAKSIDGHEYVDLGLPSGTLWAACNVGASKPHEFGGYYSWGETQTKDTYVWETYKYIKNNRFTKYNTQDENKGPIALTADDDAASVNWGNKWKTPKASDFEELGKFCYYELTRNYKQTGVSGIVFTSKINGRILFLPAAGDKMSYDDESLKSKDAEGAYLTSELDTSRSSIKEYNTVEFICDNAFSNCANLQHVKLPDAVTKIGNRAFYKCSSLATVDLPHHNVKLGESVFALSGLTHMEIPSGVDSLPEGAFYQCVRLKKVKLPIHMYVAPETFVQCDSLQEVSLPEDLKVIEYNTFLHCKNLESVKIPSTVEVVRNGAFMQCGKLDIDIPSSIDTIETGAFYGCGLSPRLLLYANNTKCYGWVGEKDACVSVEIPDSVEELNAEAFANCKKLEHVSVPKSVKSIPNYAFYNCESLRSVNIPASITSFGIRSFTNCKNLPSSFIDGLPENAKVPDYSYE